MISFSIRLDYSSSGGKGKAMSDWSENLAGKLRKKAEDQRIQDEAGNREAEIVNQGFSYLWSELRRSLEAKCREINSTKSIGIQLNPVVESDQLHIVRQDTGDSIQIAKQQQLRMVVFSGGGSNMYSQQIRVKANGNQFYFADDNQTNTPVNVMLERAIEFLLGV